jgi:hypothetical protein
MNALTEVQSVSAETLEHVLGTGDLSKLTTPQRVEYYRKTCESLGLNPLTRPIRFLILNGQTQLYFTRDGTDQLRKVNGITLHVVDRVAEAGVYSVTVRARDKHGREDEDIGAVVLPQSGESRANALMKAITKAKRRVTLSICGLGQTDESELDTMPGARVFDAEEEPPVVQIRTAPDREAVNEAVPLRAAAAPMPRAPKVADPEVYEASQQNQKTEAVRQQPRTRGQFLDALSIALNDAKSAEEVDRILCSEGVMRAKEAFTNGLKERLDGLISRALAKWWTDPPADDLPEVHIAGEELAAG